jgi:hypothetical protein
MKKIVTLRCYVRAQLKAQAQLVRYFGGNGKLDTVEENEIARCVLQSQVGVYRALQQIANTRETLDPKIQEELMALSQRKRITERLSRFVEDANNAGALSATEAHAILHPLNHEVAECMQDLSDRTEGLLKKDDAVNHHSSTKSVATTDSSKKALAAGDMVRVTTNADSMKKAFENNKDLCWDDCMNGMLGNDYEVKGVSKLAGQNCAALEVPADAYGSDGSWLNAKCPCHTTADGIRTWSYPVELLTRLPSTKEPSTPTTINVKEATQTATAMK